MSVIDLSNRDYIADYHRDGYAIIRGLFSVDEIAAIGAAVDEVHAEGLAHGRSFRHGNLFYDVAHGDAGPRVRMVQWPSYHQRTLNAVRTDPRIAAVLRPLIGGDLKQIINQLHWKVPGGGGDFAWHQDARFRKPDAAYRNLSDAYIQTGLAIDPHTPASGGMRFVPGSHAHGTVPLDVGTDVLGTAMDDAALAAAGLGGAPIVPLDLAPGDFALWNPYLVHASGENRADHLRRLYINGYVRAEDCDRGEWAFRGGRACDFGPAPVLVHYERLFEDGEPHYV